MSVDEKPPGADQSRMTQEDLRDARAALAILDHLAERVGRAFEREEYDDVAGARDLLRDWLADYGPEAA